MKFISVHKYIKESGGSSFTSHIQRARTTKQVNGKKQINKVKKRKKRKDMFHFAHRSTKPYNKKHFRERLSRSRCAGWFQYNILPHQHFYYFGVRASTKILDSFSPYHRCCNTVFSLMINLSIFNLLNEQRDKLSDFKNVYPFIFFKEFLHLPFTNYLCSQVGMTVLLLCVCCCLAQES